MSDTAHYPSLMRPTYLLICMVEKRTATGGSASRRFVYVIKLNNYTSTSVVR